MATRDDRRTREPWRRRRPGGPLRRRDGLFRLTIDQVYAMNDLGFFDDRHVELIDGLLYEMTTNPPHAVASGLVGQALQTAFAQGVHLRYGLPLDFGRRNHPEPDLAVVVGSPRDDAEAHPTTALLAVEISEATLPKDRTLKAHLYARAGLLDYWIVNLVDRQLEVHRRPGPDPDRKGRFRYADVTIHRADGHVTPLARPEARIAVADLLP